MPTEVEQLRDRVYVLSYFLGFWEGYLEGYRLAIQDCLSARFDHVLRELNCRLKFLLWRILRMS